MKKSNNKAVILYGPPGSGKGTQAELLSRRFNFIHFDTGRYIESLVHSPEADRNRELARERTNFDTGKLCTPSWVLKVTAAMARNIGEAGFGIVFSGSPRTIYEVEGDRTHWGLLKTLIDVFGKKNITIMYLAIKPGTTAKRNTARKVCSVCGLPVLASSKNTQCALCGGPTKTRTLDNADVIKVRLKEYENRTKPILALLKKKGFTITTIHGEQAPYLVHRDILRTLKLAPKK